MHELKVVYCGDRNRNYESKLIRRFALRGYRLIQKSYDIFEEIGTMEFEKKSKG